ncbi:hypothetical protein TSAR_012373 [Trichomalopsis sarcophagae]|uniref:Uncharacterized protein n=1 Tax=Trichomalopsis sarcophagae TaxID=543379 RepID=A0A232ENH9_9HYME|nr:hypothetical protein TSAR_012373 [Trichomalopsis sarcophagae]
MRRRVSDRSEGGWIVACTWHSRRSRPEESGQKAQIEREIGTERASEGYYETRDLTVNAKRKEREGCHFRETTIPMDNSTLFSGASELRAALLIKQRS